MERALVCASHQGEPVDGAPAVQTVWVAAAPAEELQAVHRSVLCREGARHCRLVPEPARLRAGALGGREEPDSGAQSHPAVAAHGAGLCRGRDARLQAARHHHVVCCARCGLRCGHHAMQVPTSPSGVPGLSAPSRPQRTGDLGRTSDHRQLRHPQTRQGARLARRASALPRSLHPNLRLLAQSSRALVCPHHPRAPPPPHIRFARPVHPAPAESPAPQRLDR